MLSFPRPCPSRAWLVLSLLSLFACCHSASAQGGYPGGGVSPGWHPLKPDGTVGGDTQGTSVLFYNYDWTHLQSHYVQTVNGQPQPTDGAYYPLSGSGNYSGDTGGVGVTSGRSDVTITLTGTSTLNYQWTPPNDAAGQPDLVNFPMPPLFVLGAVTPSAFLGYGAGGTIGGSGSGSLADGWGWKVPFNFPYSLQEPVHRKILTATGSVAQIVQITLSPRASLALSMAPPPPYQGPGGSPPPPSSASGYVHLPEYACPLLLDGPSPLVNPLRGDGGNQFVYDAQQPDGFLSVPASANAVGASSDDTAWLLPHVMLSVSPGMQANALPSTWTNSGSSIYVSTTGNYPAPNGASFPSASLIYKGLPIDSSYFGNHTMTMKVDTNVSQTANYQLFYMGKQTNHPNPDGTPNWFYYYNQLYPLASTYTVSYLAGSKSYTDSTPYHRIHIGDTAYPVDKLRVFAVNNSDSAAKVKYIGYLYNIGILNFAEVCAHEHGHQLTYTMGIAHADASGIPLVTGDGDNLDDTWEQNHHMDFLTTDTTHAYGHVNPGTQKLDDGDIPDNEAVADILALGPLFTSKSLWHQDWAEGGIQYGQPLLAVPPGANSADLYMWFYPVDSTTQNTDGTWNMGARYKVWSLNDIQVPPVFPSGMAVLSDLP